MCHGKVQLRLSRARACCVHGVRAALRCYNINPSSVALVVICALPATVAVGHIARVDCAAATAAIATVGHTNPKPRIIKVAPVGAVIADATDSYNPTSPFLRGNVHGIFQRPAAAAPTLIAARTFVKPTPLGTVDSLLEDFVFNANVICKLAHRNVHLDRFAA